MKGREKDMMDNGREEMRKTGDSDEGKRGKAVGEELVAGQKNRSFAATTSPDLADRLRRRSGRVYAEDSYVRNNMHYVTRSSV